MPVKWMQKRQNYRKTTLSINNQGLFYLTDCLGKNTPLESIINADIDRFIDYLKTKLLSITNFSTDSIFAFFIAFGFSIGTLCVNFLQNRGVSTKAGFSDFLFGNLSSLNQSDSYVIIFFSVINN